MTYLWLRSNLQVRSTGPRIDVKLPANQLSESIVSKYQIEILSC